MEKLSKTQETLSDIAIVTMLAELNQNLWPDIDRFVQKYMQPDIHALYLTAKKNTDGEFIRRIAQIVYDRPSSTD